MLQTFAYEYVPGTFMHIMPRCIMSPDVDFLCKKRLKSLYLNKGAESMELECAQMTNLHSGRGHDALLYPNETHVSQFMFIKPGIKPVRIIGNGIFCSGI